MKAMTLAISVILFGFLANASEVTVAPFIYEKWKVDNHEFEMGLATYDDKVVAEFENITLKFHANDIKKNSVESPQIWLNTRNQCLKEGTCDLILIYKNDKLVGGTYYFLESKGIVRMTCCGFEMDESLLSAVERERALKRIMDILSSSEKFPKSNRLIVCLLNDSQYIEKLKALGFTASDYKDTAYFQNNHLSFEREIK